MMCSYLQESFSKQIIRLFGFTIATYCEREEQFYLLQLYPFIVKNNNVLKWKLFQSQSLKHFIENKSIPIFVKAFKTYHEDYNNDNNDNNDNNEHIKYPIYSPVSMTVFNISGININEEMHNIYKHSSHRSHIFKSFELFKSFVIMTMIEQFYREKFKNKNTLSDTESLQFLNRNIINKQINIRFTDKCELQERLNNLKFDVEEQCVIFNVFQSMNEKFDFMLKIIKQINNEYDLNWFEEELTNIKCNNCNNNDHLFFNDIQHRFKNNNGLNKFVEMLNILFLSPIKLFNEWIVMHSEEAFLSEIASKSFMTMDITIIAITQKFHRMVMIQGVLTKADLTSCPCVTL